MYNLNAICGNTGLLNKICCKLADSKYAVCLLQRDEHFLLTRLHTLQYFVAVGIHHKGQPEPLAQPKPHWSLTSSCKLRDLGSLPDHNLRDSRAPCRCAKRFRLPIENYRPTVNSHARVLATDSGP